VFDVKVFDRTDESIRSIDEGEDGVLVKGGSKICLGMI
jgi:hypothetical protein